MAEAIKVSSFSNQKSTEVSNNWLLILDTVEPVRRRVIVWQESDGSRVVGESRFWYKDRSAEDFLLSLVFVKTMVEEAAVLRTCPSRARSVVLPNTFRKKSFQ